MLYYYCRNSTFASIVKNRSLWLSDMTQSNDRDEIHRYIGIVSDALQAKIDLLSANIAKRNRKRSEVTEARKEVYESARKKLRALEKSYYCLAICFSDAGDRLSQWHGYGDDGKGISLGFDEERIEELAGQHVLFKYDYVRYYESPDDDIIRGNLERYYEELDSIARMNGTRKDREAAVKDWAWGVLDDDAPFLKPAGFIEEKETRFCFVRDIGAAEMAAPKEDSHLNDVAFHVSGTAIVPHYELKLQDADGAFMADILKEITIGPENMSDPNTVRLFLAQNGFRYDSRSVSVKKSRIPYRSRR